jgi:hypothetical protein
MSAKWRGLNKIKEFEFEIQTLHLFFVQPNLARISFKLQKYIVSYCLGTVAATVTLGVSQGPGILKHRSGFRWPDDREIG